jgi:hypothetical protein
MDAKYVERVLKQMVDRKIKVYLEEDLRAVATGIAKTEAKKLIAQQRKLVTEKIRAQVRAQWPALLKAELARVMKTTKFRIFPTRRY